MENKKKELFVKANRYGWKDFVINVCFSLIMIASYIVIVVLTPPSTISDWVLASVVILVPLVVFVNRTLKEISYTRDYIKITNRTIEFRSTPLLTTGLFKIKRGTINLIEIRKIAIAKIPRKLSVDLFRYKKKAIMALLLRSGQQYFIGEYISNEDLFKVAEKLYITASKIKIAPETFKQYPELEDKIKKIKSKKIKKKMNNDDLKGVNIRR